MADSDQERLWNLRHREERWKRELERTARTRKWEYERQQRTARSELDRRKREIKDELGHAGRNPASGPNPEAVARGQQLDDVVLPYVVPAAAVAVLPLAAGHLAAFLINGGWPRYRIIDAPGIMRRIVTNPGDPARAWEPVNSGTPVPGPVAWWTTFVVLFLAAGLIGWMVYRSQQGIHRERSWAGWRDTRRLQLVRAEPTRVIVGTWGSRKLALRDLHSLLVLGPAHGGKTSSLTIPALLEWQGPAIVASTKGDLIDRTIGWRSHQGDVHVFDPAGVSPYRRSRWSLLATCSTWAEALGTAQDVTVAAAAAVGVTADGEDLTGAGRGVLWRSSMAKALAPFLFAAAASGRSILDVVDWIEREAHDEVQHILLSTDRAAAHAHSMAFVHPDDARTAYLRFMRQVLGVYEDPTALASVEHHEIVPGELLDGGHHTLYLTAPEHDQARFRPLSATILRQVLAHAYERAAHAAAPVHPPLLVILDQVVGIAPVDDLAAVASTGAERGVQMVSVFQDLFQIGDHYGPAAGLLVKNHRAKLVLPSLYDLDPDDDHGGLLTPDLAYQLRDGEAALLYGALRPVRTRLRPWYGVRELRRRAATPQDSIAPADRHDPAATFVAAEQITAWGRRRQSTPDVLEDPTIPLDRSDPDFTEVFGTIDADATPDNVTPFPGPGRWFRR